MVSKIVACSVNAVALVIFVTSCQKPKETSVSSERSTVVETQTIVTPEEALPLITDFQRELQAKLGAALAAGGPTAAIEICAQEAPRMAANAGNDRLKVRRIGTRTRSGANVPSAVDSEVLRNLSPEHPTHQTPGAFYQAIFTAPLCLNCHGERSNLSSEVVSLLARHYPDDQAVGYQAGELRGAFVVELR